VSMIESDLSETVTVRAVRPDVLTAEVSVLVERSNGDRRVLIFPAGKPLPDFGSEVQLTSHTVLAWD
jgi:hypothetical protein